MTYNFPVCATRTQVGTELREDVVVVYAGGLVSHTVWQFVLLHPAEFCGDGPLARFPTFVPATMSSTLHVSVQMRLPCKLPVDVVAKSFCHNEVDERCDLCSLLTVNHLRPSSIGQIAVCWIWTLHAWPISFGRFSVLLNTRPRNRRRVHAFAVYDGTVRERAFLCGYGRDYATAIRGPGGHVRFAGCVPSDVLHGM